MLLVCTVCLGLVLGPSYAWTERESDEFGTASFE
jgi:hypothetical protein